MQHLNDAAAAGLAACCNAPDRTSAQTIDVDLRENVLLVRIRVRVIKLDELEVIAVDCIVTLRGCCGVIETALEVQRD